MDAHLPFDKEAYFPNLQRDGYQVTSDATPGYNCIAHAAGKDNYWWWPVDCEAVYWPDGVEKSETLECFTQAYATQGYVACEGPDVEAGFEKVAIYVDGDGVPTHAARQLPSGRWTSKLGDWEDIEHDSLAALEDRDGHGGYGKVARVLKRPRS